MVSINVKNLTKSYGDKNIFDNISFQVLEGDKVGFIGRNGTGKSTIFKILEGSEYPDNGKIYVSPSVGYLSQIPNFPEKNR